MTANINTIASTDWSPLLGSPGDVVEDQDDIEQCMDIILNSPLGSDPQRPLFGCDAWKRIDQPLSISVPGIILDVTDALELWEPRLKVVKITPAFSANGATLTVVWQRVVNSSTITSEVTIGNNSAS